jgi:hexosaminidase
MLLKLINCPAEMRAGLEILLPDLGAMEGEGGISVDIARAPGGIETGLGDGGGYIRYERKHQFFRALGLFAEKASAGKPFRHCEKQQFDTAGIMFDCSRNAVLRPDAIRYFLRKMALMGLNLLMLYTEDTFEVPGEPYFGYLRGRYTQAELKACDDYAELFGIEMAPCIQTLAHLEQFLKWPAAEPLRDTDDILLADDEGTYAFVEKMLKAASAPFRSRRIHVGMDEAHALGLGRHLRLRGYEQPFAIMERHIRKVSEICGRLGLQPMMWSDMFFRLHNGGGYYRKGLELPEETVRRIPAGVRQVYWDYYHEDEDFYTEYIRQHERFGSMPVFAGGICTWTGAMAQNWPKTLAATTAGLSACKKKGVREVFATVWNDNGGECNYLSALNGMQLWAEMGYSEAPDMNALANRTAFCCGAGYGALEDLCAIDRLPGGEGALEPQNPGKYLLWQDPLLGLFDCHVEDGEALRLHYRRLGGRLRRRARREAHPPELMDLFAQIAALCDVLALKCALGIRIRQAYLSGDRAALGQIAGKELPLLARRVRALRELHMRNWFRLYKPSGWEVPDIRYGGLLMRIETARDRLEDYLENKADRLEELEGERLSFDGAPAGRGGWLGHFNRYSRIVTPNDLG